MPPKHKMGACGFGEHSFLCGHTERRNKFGKEADQNMQEIKQEFQIWNHCRDGCVNRGKAPPGAVRWWREVQDCFQAARHNLEGE